MKQITIPFELGETVYWITPFRNGVVKGTVTVIHIDSTGISIDATAEDGRYIKYREPGRLYRTEEDAAKALGGESDIRRS